MCWQSSHLLWCRRLACTLPGPSEVPAERLPTMSGSRLAERDDYFGCRGEIVENYTAMILWGPRPPCT